MFPGCTPHCQDKLYSSHFSCECKAGNWFANEIFISYQGQHKHCDKWFRLLREKPQKGAWKRCMETDHLCPHLGPICATALSWWTGEGLTMNPHLRNTLNWKTFGMIRSCKMYKDHDQLQNSDYVAAMMKSCRMPEKNVARISSVLRPQTIVDPLLIGQLITWP